MPPSSRARWPGTVAGVLATVIVFVLTAWAAAALYFDLPFPAWRVPAAIVYLIAVMAAMILLRRGPRGLLVALAGSALVAAWWFQIRPSNDLDWKPDNTQTAFADVNGNQVTIHNVRDCDYRTEDDFTCRWETHSYNLANLRGADLFLTWWGSPWIAHPIVSFDFGGGQHVAMSIATRNRVGQDYSAVRGFFRQYTLAYTAADERDLIRLRTNYRKDEEVYLFRTTADPALVRHIFLSYLVRMNSLHERPEWYNALTNNCTSNIAISAARAQNKRASRDWRILLNGKLDEMLYEHNDLVTGGLTLPGLKEQAHINAAARAANDRPDFSELIRKGRVGYPEEASPAQK